MVISAKEALKRLQEGNHRFISEGRSNSDKANHNRRMELIEGQNPFAIILGCSDSRVPAEIIFDQGLGDLFVIRVAGNIVTPSQIGSIEYAAESFGTKLVVVLGHSMCGAVQATLAEQIQPTENLSPNLRAIVDNIRPAVVKLFESEIRHDKEALIHHAVRANIQASANHLRHGSKILEQLIAQDRLTVVGAEYSLFSGQVEFFDGLPESA